MHYIVVVVVVVVVVALFRTGTLQLSSELRPLRSTTVFHDFNYMVNGFSDAI